MYTKLTITIPFVCALIAGCGGVRGGHLTSAGQIDRVTGRVSESAEYTCRPSDPKRAGDYIWLSTDTDAGVRTLRITNYASLGKSGYRQKELVLLNKIERSETAGNVEYKTGADTWGSYDTEYDFSSPVTLLSINTINNRGRLRIKGYAGNLEVTCAKNS